MLRAILSPIKMEMLQDYESSEGETQPEHSEKDHKDDMKQMLEYLQRNQPVTLYQSKESQAYFKQVEVRLMSGTMQQTDLVL